MLGALQVTVPGHGCTLLGDGTQFGVLVLSCHVLPSLGCTPGCPCSHHSLSSALEIVSPVLSLGPAALSSGSGGQ